MAVTYTFSTQSGSIPLAQLDANFATPITIGNTSVQLGNTITTLNNITLANTTISGGNVTLTNVSITTANVTTANITNAVIGTANVTTANVGTLTLTNALGTASGGTGLTSFTSGGVVYASSGSALSTGSALTFDGTNLGVGTSSPSFKLDVAGGVARLQQGFQILDTDGYFAFANKTVGATGNYGLYYSGSTSSVQIWTASSQRVTIDSSGNLGLGVTPSAWSGVTALQIAGSGAIGFNNQYGEIDTNAYYNAGYKYIGTGLAAKYDQSAGQHRWFNAPSGTAGNAITFTQAMTLDASGNLGIGTSSPTSYANYIYQTIQGTNGAGINLRNNAGTALSEIYQNSTGLVISSVSNLPMLFNTNNTERMRLDTSGNLTVPAMYSTTVTTPRNVFIDSTGKMGGISSTRASKTNISQLNSASWIYELNPVTFNYLKKDEEGEYLEEFEEEQQFGLIAEEVELVKPELCIYTDDKVSGIHYDRMIAPLIKAIQELKAEVDSLKAQLEAK